MRENSYQLLRLIRMARRTAKVTVAELKRAIQAAQAADLYVTGIVARGDEYLIETSDEPAPQPNGSTRKPTPVL